jgi:large subunit ribosomal protein L3
MVGKAVVVSKVGMTQVWDQDRRVVPVTVLRVEPQRVVRVKRRETDGYCALQVAVGFKPEAKLNKPLRGVYAKAGVEPGERLVELRLDDVDGYEVGQELKADLFSEGDVVDVTGTSKGRGFAGTMKRHNFAGQGASHGNHKKHRAPGSIGACATPARVFKGLRMAGRMGGVRVTTLNLKVVRSDPDSGLMMVKGAVPGPRGSLVVVREAVKAKARSKG